MTPVANTYFSGCGLMDLGLARGGGNRVSKQSADVSAEQ